MRFQYDRSNVTDDVPCRQWKTMHESARARRLQRCCGRAEDGLGTSAAQLPAANLILCLPLPFRVEGRYCFAALARYLETLYTTSLVRVHTQCVHVNVHNKRLKYVPTALLAH